MWNDSVLSVVYGYPANDLVRVVTHLTSRTAELEFAYPHRSQVTIKRRLSKSFPARQLWLALDARTDLSQCSLVGGRVVRSNDSMGS
jgi:hypothetical protein